MSDRDRKYDENRDHDRSLKRSRQWVTVDSSSDDDSDSSSDDSVREDKTSLQDVKRENSGQHDSSSNSSSDDEKHKKSKKDEKKSHKIKDKHKDKKKDKHKDKDKDRHGEKEKHKKSKKKHKHERKSTTAVAVNQNEYGKYGIIREEHYHQKQREFEIYMEEVKGMPGILGQSKREIMKYFKDFTEDYNTATMPHEKYYNFEKWEMYEYKKSQESQQRLRQSERDVFDDEYERKAEIKRLGEKAEREQFELTKQRMLVDKDKRNDMRHQELLRAELKLAHRQGDKEKVQRLERALAPDPQEATVKHPWS